MTEREHPQKVFAQGHLIDGDFIPDLISFLSQSRRSAALSIQNGRLKRSLYFHQGEVMAASSNLPENRFGSLLLQRGQISPEQLEFALLQVNPGRRLGAVLFELGLLSVQEVWETIRLQIQEICYSIILQERGEFSLASYKASSLPTLASLSGQHLLMEGLRRKDEQRQLLESLPGTRWPLEWSGPPPQLESLGRAEAIVYMRLEEGLILSELLRRSELSNFETLKAAQNLIQKGLIQEAEPRVIPELEIIEGFNESYARIWAVLESFSQSDPSSTLPERDGLSLGRDPELVALFEGLRADRRGRLPKEALLTRLQRSSNQDRLQLLRRGLREHLRFLLFLTREHLPYTEVECLSAEIQDLTRRF